jgi:hypothetical protein
MTAPVAAPARADCPGVSQPVNETLTRLRETTTATNGFFIIKK